MVRATARASGKPFPLYVCVYGQDDPTKSCHAEWRLNDYTLALKKITQAVYLDTKAGVAPYTTRRPAPTVSRYFVTTRSRRWCVRGCAVIVLFLLQLFQVVEGWLPPADDENSRSSVQDGSESSPAKGNAESDGGDDDDVEEDEPVEVAARHQSKTKQAKASSPTMMTTKSFP